MLPLPASLMAGWDACAMTAGANKAGILNIEDKHTAISNRFILESSFCQFCRSLIHCLRQRSRTAGKAGAAVVSCRDVVRARGQRRGCELCHAAAQSHRL